MMSEDPRKAIDLLMTQASVSAAYGDYQAATQNMDEANQLRDTLDVTADPSLDEAPQLLHVILCPMCSRRIMDANGHGLAGTDFA